MPEGGAFELTQAQRDALEAKAAEPGPDPELILTQGEDTILFVAYDLPDETDLDPLVIPDPEQDATKTATLDQTRFDPTYGLIIDEEATDHTQPLPDSTSGDDVVFFL